MVNSFSKSYAMTGWRVGYAYGPRWIIDPMTKVVSHCTSCTPSVSQRAALAALRMDPAVVEDMAQRFAARSELLYEGLRRLPGFRVNKPAGSFYMFPDVSQLTDDTYRFALDLLQEERVAVVPGFPFGPSGVGCIRLACTVGRDKIAEAVVRIGRFVARRLDRTRRFAMPIRAALIREIRSITGPGGCLDQPEDLRCYSYDLFARGFPDLVVLPQTTEETARVLKLANEEGIPVTPRGAGSSLTGGPVPVRGGISLCLARMNRILEFSPLDRLARVQPGVVTRDFQRAVARKGLLLSTRSGLVALLHPGRKRGHQRRRAERRQVRRHARLSPRPHPGRTLGRHSGDGRAELQERHRI